MDWLMHNPIAEMYGPHFLILYGCLVALTLLGCWWGIRSRDPTADLPALPVPEKPDPYEVAYLRGSENEVTRLVIFNLIQRGYLEAIEIEKDQLAQTPNHPDPRYLSPIQREVFEGFSTPCKASDVFQEMALPDRVKHHCETYDKQLESEQLLCPSEVKETAWPIGITGALIILGLGGYKLAAALATGHSNVLFLVIMGLVALGILAAVCKPPRLSSRGQAYLKRLQLPFEPLKEGTISVTPSLLLVALFGIGVLVGTHYAYFEQMFREAAASGGGCGGGCGGCGGDADADGGGCGGCGGCGDFGGWF
jgi:uncharacterized protein (TIGR04222 family)